MNDLGICLILFAIIVILVPSLVAGFRTRYLEKKQSMEEYEKDLERGFRENLIAELEDISIMLESLLTDKKNISFDEEEKQEDE